MAWTNIASIAEATAAETRLPLAALMGPRRSIGIARPRQIAMFLARETGQSFPKIGAHFRRDHTTVMYATREIGRLQASDPEIAATIARIRLRLDPAMPPLQSGDGI